MTSPRADVPRTGRAFRCIAGLALIAPVVATGVLCALYLWQVASHLQQQAVGAVIGWAESEWGVRVQMGDVSADLRRGQLVVRNVFLGDPFSSATPLIAARKVTVSNLYSRPINIQVDHPVAHLVRLPDGRWNFSPLLPKRRRPPTETFWQVRIEDGTLHFEDHKARPSVKTTIQQVAGEIRSSTGVSTFHFTHGTSDLGAQATVNGWLYEGHLRLRVDASNVPVPTLLSYVKRLPLDAGDARTSGTVWVYTDEHRRIRYTGRAQVSASRAQWKSPQGVVVLRQLQGEGIFQTGIASWDARASVGSGRIAADGVVRWQPQVAFDARVEARGVPPEALRSWVRRYAPQVRLEAPVDAQLGVKGTPSAPHIEGTVRTAHATVDKIRVQEIRAKVVSNAHSVRMTDGALKVGGGTVRLQASAWRDRAGWQFGARWAVQNLNLARLGAYLPSDVRGSVHAEGVAYGSLSSPTVVANLRGERLAGKLWRCEQAQARVRWTPGKLTVDGAMLEDWSGSGYVSGEIDLSRKQLALRVRVDEVLLLPWLERLASQRQVEGDLPSAWVYARGELQGTFAQPVFRGVVEAIDLQWQRWALDYLVARVTASPDNVLVEGGIVRRPPMEVQWQAQVEHPLDKEKARLVLDGIANNADVRELISAVRPPDAEQEVLPLDAVARVFFHVSGPLRSPSAEVTVSSPTLQFHDWSLTAITGELHYADGSLRVNALSGRLGDGTVRVQGERDRDGNLSFRVEGDNLPLAQLKPLLPEEDSPDIRGSASLRAEVTGPDQKPQVRAEITVQDAAVDVWKVTRGYAQAEWYDGVMRARGVSLESPELQVELDSLQMDSRAQTLTAEGTLSVASLTTLSRLAMDSPYLTGKVPRLGEVLRELGQIAGSGAIPFRLSGDSKNPVVEASLSAENLQLDGRLLGTLRAQVQRDSAGAWHLADALLANGEHRVTASGSYRPDGTLTLTAEAYNVDLSWFQRWLPHTTEVQGKLEMATVEAEGVSEAPDLTITLALREPRVGGVRADRVLTGKIQVSQDKLNISEIVVAQRDGSVRIWGTLPFRWQPIGVPDDEPIEIRAEAAPQPLTSLLAFVPGVNVSEVEGQWRLTAQLAGTRAVPQLSGEVSVQAEKLRTERLRTGLRDLRVLARLENQTIQLVELSAVGDSPRGGRVSASGEITFGEGEQERLDATLRLERFWLEERNLSGQYGEQVRTFLDGELRLTGNVESPQVSGMIIASGGGLALPSSFPEQRAEVRPLAVNPRFANVVLRLGEGMWLNSPRLATQASGDVVLSGTLQEPVVHGQLGLERGYVYFPTARFRLEPGGTIALDYPVPGDNPFRVAVNVQANTSLSFASPTGASRRYNITVLVNGTITSPEGLKTEFRSDPPDLSTQQIARALGVGTLEELLTGRNMEQVLQREVVNLFTSAYVPQLFSPLERGIEEALQLREFRIEYDRYAPMTVTLVKRLWDGFSLSYWRTVSAQQDRYTLKILYELPEWTRLSRRLLLSFSVDEKQQTRWGIEGSFRF